MRVCIVPLLCGLVVLVAGCGDGMKLAPVSGQVLVDGKAYPNAYVTFQPMATKRNANPGKGSMGITDTEGRFTLRYDDGRPGAIVGKHIVRITSMQPADDPKRFKDTKVDVSGSADGDDPKGLLSKKGLRPEVIPLDWHTDSTREFEVPAGGKDDFKFEITSIQAQRKGKR